jgi:ABC-2 type transport system permease protein
MWRHLRLFLYCVRFSCSRAMAFRLDFFFRMSMDLTYYAANIVLFQLIYHHTSLLGGWTANQIMVFVGAYLVIDAVFMTLFSNNMWWLPQFVNRGDLDYYLIRPASTLFFLSIREFSANAFINLIMAVSILIWAILECEQDFILIDYVSFVIFLGIGSFLHYLSNLLFLTPVFWMHSARGLGLVWFTFSRFIERPDRIFTGVTRVLLTTCVPFSLMASFPARLFLEGFDWRLAIHLVIVTILFFVLTLIAWNLGLRHYTSASS